MSEASTWRIANELSYRAFDAAVRRDMQALAERCEAKFLSNPAALQAEFDHARQCGDGKAVEVMALVLDGHGALDPQGRISYAQALMFQRRYVEAAAVFDHPSLQDLGSVRNVSGRAHALAGAGRYQAALEAAQRALAAHPDHLPTQTLRDRLLALIPLDGRRAELDAWPELGALLQGYLDLDAREEAAALMRRLMTTPDLAPVSSDDRLGLAEMALQVCSAAEVAAYLGRGPADPSQRRDALTIACDVLSGRSARLGQHEPAAPMTKGLRIWRALACEAAGDFPNAIRQLCALAEEDKRDPEIRTALARVVGRRVLAEVRPGFEPGGSGRIVNLVVFNDEFALLRMHLEEMAPFVDRFVIVEAGQTFMGAQKPLHFHENRDRFADFADRIVHLAIPDFPAELTTAWARDFYQRDMAIAAAQGLCGQEDYLLATDTDEVVARRVLDGFCGDYACLHLVVSRFFLNYRMTPGSPKAMRPASAIFKAKHLMEHGISHARFFLARRWSNAYVIRGAGWHFTSVNDADRIALKLSSYAHQEQVKARFKTPEHFRQVLDRIRAGEMEPGWERVDLDDGLPDYVRQNQAALADLIL